MPKKTTANESTTPRRVLERAQVEVIIQTKHCYESLQQLKNSVHNLKSLRNWTLTVADSHIILEKFEVSWKVAKIKITIDDGLGYTVKSFDWLLPEDHWIYKENRRSMQNVSLFNLVQTVESFSLCQGTNRTIDGSIIDHVIPKDDTESVTDEEDDIERPIVPYKARTYYRSLSCVLLIKGESGVCEFCAKFQKTVKYNENKSKANLNKPASLKAPISKTHGKKVLFRIQNDRLKCAQLESRCKQMEMELKKVSVTVDSTLTNDFVNIISKQQKLTPFMTLFWQQQQKLFERNPKGARFHPMLIRYEHVFLTNMLGNSNPNSHFIFFTLIC